VHDDTPCTALDARQARRLREVLPKLFEWSNSDRRNCGSGFTAAQ
jgi:hypothetical protein